MSYTRFGALPFVFLGFFPCLRVTVVRQGSQLLLKPLQHLDRVIVILATLKIVLFGVVEHQTHIVNKSGCYLRVVHDLILTAIELFIDRAQVHRFLYISLVIGPYLRKQLLDGSLQTPQSQWGCRVCKQVHDLPLRLILWEIRWLPCSDIGDALCGGRIGILCCNSLPGHERCLAGCGRFGFDSFLFVRRRLELGLADPLVEPLEHLGCLFVVLAAGRVELHCVLPDQPHVPLKPGQHSNARILFILPPL